MRRPSVIHDLVTSTLASSSVPEEFRRVVGKVIW
jgi:hypothetical protein